MNDNRSSAIDFQPDYAVQLAQRERLFEMWEMLALGRTRILGEISSSQRTGLVLTQRPASHADCALSPRERGMVESVLVSNSQKAAAIDSGLPQSVVAEVMHRSFEKLGLSCTYRTAPVLLVLMMLSLRRGVLLHGLSIESEVHDEASVVVISAERPDVYAETLLSPAESAVAHLIFDGRSHQQMALVRRTSRRTIANQVASIHSKLGASGRMDLISRLSTLRAARPEGLSG